MVAAALAAIFAAPGALSAKPQDPPQSMTLTYEPLPVEGKAATLSTIVCTFSIDNPHKSTHDPATVNVVAHLTCPIFMDSLSINVKLYRGVVQAASQSCTKVVTTFVNCNAASNCVNAQYYGWAKGIATAPPGYTPPSQTGYVQSPVVTISTC